MPMARSPRRGWRGTLGLIAAAVIAASTLLATPAWAHAELTSVSPADGDVLTAPPRTIELTFSEPLITAAATVVVTDDRGLVVTRDRSRVDGTSVSIPWPVDLPPGDYTIAYRVVSGDGHPIKGTSRFTLSPAVSTSPPTGSPAPQPQPEPTPTEASASGRPTATPSGTVPAASDPAAPPTVLPTLALAAFILGGIALGSVLLVRRRRAP